MTAPAMTVDPVVQSEAAATPPPGRDRREVAEWVAFFAALGLLALYVLPRRGGWEADVVPTAVLAMLPSLLVLRPWRNCSRLVLVAAGVPALGACVVAAASPFGDGGPISLSRWGLFGVLLMVTASFARTPARRQAVVVGLLLVGLLQYAQAWLPWWGGGDDATRSMLGTLYSANPFGGLMLVFALLAGSVALLGSGSWHRLGWLVAPLATCGVVFSAARAAILALLVGGVLLAVLALRVRRTGGLVRWLALVPLCVLTVVVSSGPLVFDVDRGSAVAAKDASGQTLDSTSGVRLDYWRAAVGVFREQPLVGGGSGSYLPASRPFMAPAAERSPFAHNEALGALAEGGLALGLPVLLVLVVSASAFSGVVLRALRRRGESEPALIGAALAGGGLVAHSLVDFALSFPAVLALLGVLAGLAVASVPRTATSGGTHVLLGGTAVAAVLVAGCYVGFAHDDAGVGTAARGNAQGVVTATGLPGVRDARVPAAVARAAVRDGVTGRPAIDAALEGLSRLTPLDASLRSTTIQLLAAKGEASAALEGALVLARDESAATPLLVLPLLERLEAAGRRADAVTVATSLAALRAGESARVQGQLVQVLGTLEKSGAVEDVAWSCALVALEGSGADVERLTAAQAPITTTSASCRDWLRDASERAARVIRGEA